MIERRRGPSFAASGLALALALPLPACTSMLETSALDAATLVGCLDGSGAYFLPKKLLTVTVEGKEVADGKVLGYGLNVKDDWRSVPDRGQSYCLDYLGSITSRDEVGIVRTPEGLLVRVYTRAEDRSVAIAKTLIDTAFLTGAGGREALGKAGGPEAGPFTFDPFDPFEAAKINAALRPFGYCVFVEAFSFPYGVPPETWCEQPRVLSIHVSKGPPLADELPPVAVSARGVLYRPNITRTLTVMRKAPPQGRGPWLLAMTKKIEVPNRAPVFVAEVNRSLFVDRVTDLEFRDGVLTNVSVKKPSEVAAFVEIPLAVVSAVVALPGTVVKLKINEANNQERLIRAQSELIAVRRLHQRDIDALVQKHGSGALAGIPLTPDNRSMTNPDLVAKMFRNCLETGRTEDECRRQ